MVPDYNATFACFTVIQILDSKLIAYQKDRPFDVRGRKMTNALEYIYGIP